MLGPQGRLSGPSPSHNTVVSFLFYPISTNRFISFAKEDARLIYF
jgi:hypothetical protein